MTTKPDVASASSFPAATEQEWLDATAKVLKGRSFDDVLVSTTYDGIELQPLYTAGTHASTTDLPGRRPDSGSLAFKQPASGSWNITSHPLHPDPAGANAEILADLEGGAEGVHATLDVGGRGEMDGVVVSSAADLSRLLDGVLFDVAPVCLSAGSSFAEAAAMLADVWQSSKVSNDAVSGSFGADPFSALLTSGFLPMAMEEALRSVAMLAADTAARFGSVTAIDVSGAVVSDAGASDAQELAYLLASTASYLEAMLDEGLSLEAAAGQISWTATASPDVFATVSKLRAARRLWAHLLSVSGADSTTPLRLSAVTARRSLTRRDPWVNMLRGTASCFAAAVGGAEAISVAPFDSALGVSSAHGRRVARNTQLLLREESHLAKVIDPTAGSFYVETYTAELVDSAWDLFVDLASDGGLLEAITSGTFAAQIEAVRSVRDHNVDHRRDPITGVSEFPNLEETEPDTVEVDRSALRARAGGGSGQPEEVLRVAPLMPHAVAGRFESLRSRSDAFLESNGRRPSVFLATLGSVASHTARATYATNLYNAGGFEVHANEGFADAASASRAFSDSAASVAVICGSDDTYEDMAIDVAEALTSAGARRVVLAGRPGGVDAMLAAGVHETVHMGCNVLAALENAWQIIDGEAETSPT